MTKQTDYKMTREQAKKKLYSLWEYGLTPSNFTPDHSEYNRAVNELMKYGFIEWSDYFQREKKRERTHASRANFQKKTVLPFLRNRFSKISTKKYNR